MEPFLIGAAIAVVIVLVFGGAVQTFKREPVVAILCVIFLGPIWIIWAFIEIFLPSPSRVRRYRANRHRDRR